MDKLSRRNFLSITALGGATLLPKPGLSFANTSLLAGQEEKNLTFLFQGDSITDGNRGRSADPNHIMGHGYAFAIASRLAADFAENNFSFFNRGICGNRIPDLQSRWQQDTLPLKPDVLSILIGINDVDAVVHQWDSGQNEAQFKADYRALLQQSQAAKPDTLFVLAPPFVYRSPKTEDAWNLWNTEVQKRREAVKELAQEFDAVLVDYTPVFEKAMKRQAAEYWIWDGIHPTIAGHEIMAREWIKKVSGRLKFMKRYQY